ncbi:MAG: GC-type dockerin domain-anchored protein [Phycisphaerales bacterium]
MRTRFIVALAVIIGCGVAVGQPIVPGATVELLGTLPNGYRPYQIDWGIDSRGEEWGRWVYFGSDNNVVTGVPLVRLSLGTAQVGAGQVLGFVETYSVPVYDADGFMVDRSGGLTGRAGTALVGCADDVRGRIWLLDAAEATGTDAAPTRTYVAPMDSLNNCDTMTVDGAGRLYLDVPTFNQVQRMVGLPNNGAGVFEVFASLPTSAGTVAWDGMGGVWTSGGDGVMRRFAVDGPLPRPVDLAVNTGTGTENGLTWSRVVPGIGGPWGGGMLVVRRGSGGGQLVRIRNNGLVDVLGALMGDVYGLTVDDAGVLYAADYSNGAVWRITRTARLGCGPADVGGPGGQPASDGALDNNDFIAFINYFFAQDAKADFGGAGGLPGADGQYNNNDFIAFISAFFEGC